ncbi:MAG: hypothetical protein RLZZ135_1493 [Cyanobacteriota bacterium]|jgi:hypothetical protein
MNDTQQLDLPADTITVEMPVNPQEMDDVNILQTDRIAPDVKPIEQPESLEKFRTILAELPSYIGKIYQNNQGAFITVGIFFGIIVALKLMVALLSAIEGIPFMASILEIIGLGYTGWLVWRYLLHASTRDELNGEINNLKSEILGNYQNN